MMNTEGKESEWNEANFKSRRLDSAQTTINVFKMNPTGMTDRKFNYIWMIKGVDLLYGEGISKYSHKEIKEVDKLRDLVFKSLKYNPPHQRHIRNGSNGSAVETFRIDEKNLEILMDLLELFERKVKHYNDEHGLTTKNRGSGGLF